MTTTIPDKPASTHEDLMAWVAKSGDRAAFRALFDHFAPRVKSYILGMKLADSEAEELMQDVMLTVWRKAALFDPEKARVSTWIFRVARNKVIDSRRRRKLTEVSADDLLTEMPDDAETDRPLIEKQNAVRVKAALDRLKPNLRIVIEKSFFEEMSHTEIAEALDLPLGTAKSRIRLAFQQLRKELDDLK